MEKEVLFSIAKIIDNEYVGKGETFTATRKGSYWYLSTNICDMASFIKVFEKDNKISSIYVLGDYTNGWEEVSEYTWEKIKKYLPNITTNRER